MTVIHDLIRYRTEEKEPEFIAIRLRIGEITEQNIKDAARLGFEPARTVLGDKSPRKAIPRSDSTLDRYIRRLSIEQNVTFAISVAAYVLPFFEEVFPEDKRPREALLAAKAWMDNPTEENLNAARLATAAAFGAADEVYEDAHELIHPEIYASAAAAYACSVADTVDNFYAIKSAIHEANDVIDNVCFSPKKNQERSAIILAKVILKYPLSDIFDIEDRSVLELAKDDESLDMSEEKCSNNAS